MRTGRGFSLIELLVSMFILLLFFAIAYAALLPVLSYLNPAQAKINTVQNAVPLLYKLQREVRQSRASAIFAWQSGAAVPLTPTLTNVSTFAVPSAKSGAAGSACFPGGDFQTVPSSGAPYWQGFEVFMLQNAALNCVFEPFPGGQQSSPPAASDAAIAIGAATAVTNPPIFGNAVLDIKAGVDTTPFVVDFQIKAASTVNGRSNTTTYTEAILTRD